jgi:3-hydroxyacyl-CoA dehydrogenase
MEREGRELPVSIQWMLQGGSPCLLYTGGSAKRSANRILRPPPPRYEEIEARPGVMVCSERRRAGRIVKRNAGASLVDLGDGVLCLEFHSKMNTLGEDIFSMMYAVWKRRHDNGMRW